MSEFKLPSDVAERLAYYENLMGACARLSYADVVTVLWAEYRKQEARGYRALNEFVSQLPHYISKHLPPDVRQQLNGVGGTLTWFRSHLRVVELLPENWPFWAPWERDRLIYRRKDVVERLELAEREGRMEHAAEHTANVERIDRILAACTAAEASGSFVVNASEIDGTEPTTPQEVADTEQPNSSCPNLSHRQIALIRHYEGGPDLLDDDRSQALATAHGHMSKTSGRVLARSYREVKDASFFSSRKDRSESSSTTRLINDIKIITPMLQGIALKKAENDLKQLTDTDR